MMVESKAVAVVLESSQSRKMKKKKMAIFNELHYKVDVIVFRGSGDGVDNGSFPLQRCPNR